MQKRRQLAGPMHIGVWHAAQPADELANGRQMLFDPAQQCGRIPVRVSADQFRECQLLRVLHVAPRDELVVRRMATDAQSVRHRGAAGKTTPQGRDEGAAAGGPLSHERVRDQYATIRAVDGRHGGRQRQDAIEAVGVVHARKPLGGLETRNGQIVRLQVRCRAAEDMSRQLAIQQRVLVRVDHRRIAAGVVLVDQDGPRRASVQTTSMVAERCHGACRSRISTRSPAHVRITGAGTGAAASATIRASPPGSAR